MSRAVLLLLSVLGSCAAAEPPAIPRHHAHLRVALLAYSGNPMGAFEDDLLRHHVDLVVTAPHLMAHVRAVAPRTPQLVYTNTSNLYLGLLTDWLEFAEANGLPREAAFYHAVKAVPFRGDSPSSRPVTWFWHAVVGGDKSLEVTDATRGRGGRLVTFPGPGGAVVLGHPDRFAEVNVDLAAGAGTGWACELEYPAGRGVWKALAVKDDTTDGLERSGRVSFRPPSDWQPIALGDGVKLHYVRFRTTREGTAPRARTLLGRDYVGAGGMSEGIVPAFDAAADANGDGYLDDAEYARRTPGKDARFLHESRLPCGSYGQMRFAANPSRSEFRRWAVDYHRRFLGRHPAAAGLFMDNAMGKPPLRPADAVEPTATYAVDTGGLLAELRQALAPQWVLANTAGGGKLADEVVRGCPAYLEEFVLRPLALRYVQFEEVAATVERRRTLANPPPLAVLDTHPQRGSPMDPRTQLAALAAYYLVADPESTFLMFFGGSEPATPWSRHWVPAAARDIGRPRGPMARLAEGPDPANSALTYRVYQRPYEKALVLYKPLAHHTSQWRTEVALGDESATEHDLPGRYRPLRADGSVGEPVGRIRLRNGEGAVQLPLE